MKAGWMTDRQNDVKWTPVIILSVVFHLAIFSSILFIPDSYSARRSFDGIIYEVNLVEMPGGGGTKAMGGTPPKPQAVSNPETQAKRIEEVPKREETPVVIAKKTLEEKAPPVEKPKESPADLLHKALSKNTLTTPLQIWRTEPEAGSEQDSREAQRSAALRAEPRCRSMRWKCTV